MTDVTVKKGSNLSETVSQYNKAHRTKLTVAQVAKANHLKDANKVQAGQKLHLGDTFESKPKTPSTGPKIPTRFPLPKTSTPAAKTQTRVGAPCKEPNIFVEMNKKRQADLDKLFPNNRPVFS